MADRIDKVSTAEAPAPPSGTRISEIMRAVEIALAVDMKAARDSLTTEELAILEALHGMIGHVGVIAHSVFSPERAASPSEFSHGRTLEVVQLPVTPISLDSSISKSGEAETLVKNEFSPSALKTLSRLFGQAGMHIEYNAENINAIIGAIKNPYLTNRTSRNGGHLQIHRLKLHLEGQTDRQIGTEENPPRTANGPREGRHSMLTRIDKFSTIKTRLDWLRAVAERRELEILDEQYTWDYNEDTEGVDDKPPINLHHDVEILVGSNLKRFYESINRHAGEAVLDPKLASEDEAIALLDLYAQSNQSSRATIDDDIARQVEQLRLYFSGMGPTAIARELGLDSRKLVSGSMASVASIIGRALQSLPVYNPADPNVTEIPVSEEVAKDKPEEQAGIPVFTEVSQALDEVEERAEMSDLLKRIEERFGSEVVASWHKLFGGSESKDELESIRSMFGQLMGTYAPSWRPHLEGPDNSGLTYLHWRAIECIVGSQNSQGLKMQSLEGAARQLRAKLNLRGFTIEEVVIHAADWLLSQTSPAESSASRVTRPTILESLPSSSRESFEDSNRIGASVLRKLSREGLIGTAQETMLLQHFGYRPPTHEFKAEHIRRAIVTLSQVFGAALEKVGNTPGERPKENVVPLFNILLGNMATARDPVSRKELRNMLASQDNKALRDLDESQLDEIIDAGFEWLQHHKVRR